MTHPNKDNDKKQEEHEVKTCLTCAHLGDDQHCEIIECQDCSGWTPAKFFEQWRFR